MRRAGRSALAAALRAARDHSLALLDSPPAAQPVPHWSTINPPRWELGHVAWFQEWWCVRDADAAGRTRRDSLLPGADACYHSGLVPHATRWTLALPSHAGTRAYLRNALDATLDRLAAAADDDAGLYPFRLALFHEQMHAEAMAATWHALGHPPPPGWTPGLPAGSRDDRPDTDLAFDAATVRLGTDDGIRVGFTFDNERCAHAVHVAAFRIAARCVDNAAFADFVADGGYRDARWWTPPALARLRAEGRAMPAHWRGTGADIEVRAFDRWAPMAPHEPVMHVSADEAEAWCRWAGRRLPTEAEWEAAAASGRLPAWGTRVWEWTASAFAPYPGFAPDRYGDYSEPWFGTHRVARGGSLATPRALVDARFRNFWLPQRTDQFTGFRTCAVQA